MAKCHRNNVDSLILHRISSASSSSSASGNTFSGTSLRRIIFDAISCGGSSRYQRELREEDDEDASKSITIGEDLARKSEKLCDLLNLAVIESVVETKKKEETLEILKRVVRDLQVEAETAEKKIVAASEVRLLAKDDTEARVTLAMLGAIPPLVSMIDDYDSQIASLYALLNLGIGNDM